MKTIFVITDEDSFYNAVNMMDDLRMVAASIQLLVGELANELTMSRDVSEMLSSVYQKAGCLAERAVELQQSIFDLVEERNENHAT